MKKNFFSAAWLIAGAAVMFSSCSNDEDVINGGNGNGNEPVQIISMQVANTGDNFLGTRAANDRPLYSSAAMQNIENVKVVLYKLEGVTNESSDAEKKAAMYGSKTIVAEKTFTPWMNGGVSSTYNDATKGHGRQASWTLATADLIKEEGMYAAYAVGYNTDNYTELGTFNGLAKGGSITTPLNVTVGNGGVKEIFAGSALFEVTKNTQVVEGANVDSYHFNVSLTLHRQVAGSIGYFTNIPTKGNADYADKEGAKLRLVASAKNTQAVFAGFNSVYTGLPGESATNVKYVVNGHTTATADAKFYGSTANDAFSVYEIVLANWFKGTSMDTNNDGLLNELDTDWENALDATNKDIVKVDAGSVLGGSFMIPFELVENKATFQLQMLDADGGIIRYWNIRLPQANTADSQIGKNVTVVAKGGTESVGSVEENNINYSIVRNHLYTIGKRDGGDVPTDPGTDPDKPQDLNDETLLLRVNDNWEMIHHMEVD